MEGRARRRASPAGMRTKPTVTVRVEPEPPTTRRHEPGTRAAVVYYLTRNHHLEHPHFMEVTLASPQGLYLRDVIGRLDALRGNGMAAKYSWSCKRSYKTGFVWHDLSADDLLLPTQGTEYVLKGSELPFHHSNLPLPLPDHQQNNAACADKAKDHQPCKPAPQQDSPPSPGSSSNQGWASKSPSPIPTTYPAVPAIKEDVVPPPPRPRPPPTTTRAAAVPAMKEDAVPPPPPHPVSPSTPSASSSNSSPKTSMASSSVTSSPSPTKPAAATQTEDKARWDDLKLQRTPDAARPSSSPERRPEIVVDEPRGLRAPAGEHPRSRRSGTLQSLIRAEAAGRRRALPLPEEDDTAAAAAATGGSVSGRLKPANLLMRLMACGPNHPGFGLVQNTSSYRPPRFAQLEYPSSPELFPLGALKPGTAGASTVRASETENCSGRLLDGALKLSSSSSSSRSHHEGSTSSLSAPPTRARPPPLFEEQIQVRRATSIAVGLHSESSEQEEEEQQHPVLMKEEDKELRLPAMHPEPDTEIVDIPGKD
ncbi:Protein UPSTREAM OF FLC [Hordeum vulgare]|nr:Protein UPSTREAM OF FLC [Hordeum vulgare]